MALSPFFYCCVDRPFEACLYQLFTSSDWALPQLTSTMDCSDFSILLISPSLLSTLLETYSFKKNIQISQVPKRYFHDHALLSDSGPDVNTKTIIIVSKSIVSPLMNRVNRLPLYTISELNHFTFVTA